ncbi:MAG TPA: ATP-dependent helicase [Candidatus Microsaccharimonas sp.]|jgi:DNA helicase-2/ATP-dependent DNA helicase PcrA
MIAPTPKQLEIRDALVLDLLVIAPAGCGKTEALALRAQGLLDRGVVAHPQKLLVTTFSNRARDNVRERLASYLSPSLLRERISISNFHGVASRLFRAHANTIGLDPAMILPESDWVAEQCRQRGLNFNAAAVVQTVLRETKQEPRNDEEVDVELVRRGNADALAIERLRISEGRLTYDDLPRIAELILSNDVVADLYASHFAAVIVDEFQDLTPQQLRIVNRIGYKRTTFAGDLAQGIYGFAGAQPVEIDRAIRAECAQIVEFSESHRSSPAVLAVVNELAPLTHGQALTCADPSAWPEGGLAGSVAHDTAAAEADWIVKLSSAILSRAPGHRIGVLARTVGRRRFADAAFAASSVPHYRWDDGVLDTDTAKVVKAMLARFDLRGYLAAADKLIFLRDASGFEAISDTDGRRNLADALGWVHDLLADGVLPDDLRSRIKVGDSSTLISTAGVHLLTGHVGKGQQFDWVVVVGLEEDILPDFRAKTSEALSEEARVLSVMVSRARHGVILAHAADVPNNAGKTWIRTPSRFLSSVAGASPLNAHGIVEWFRAADWPTLSVR